MADATQTKLAQETYRTLLKAIELNGWKCGKDDEKLSINFGVNGDDLHMNFRIFIDVDRQLVRLFSPLPFHMSMERIMQAAIATCMANYSLADGCFDLDLTDGELNFKMTTSFRGSVIAPEALKYMINIAASTVDNFNDHFLMISNGSMSLDKFHELHN